jgi:hypothetical protein
LDPVTAAVYLVLFDLMVYASSSHNNID